MRERLLRHLAAAAITSPFSLFLLTTAGLLALHPVLWPAAAAVGAAEAVWLWSLLRSPRFAQRCGAELAQGRRRGLVLRLEELAGSLDPETSTALTAIVEAQERLIGPGGAAERLLPESREEMTSLLRHCLFLTEKRQELAGYLSTCRLEETRRQSLELEQRLAQLHDPAARRLYGEALEQKRQELENYARLEENITRIDGQLAAVRATFENMLSRIAIMQAAEPAGVEPDAVAAELTRLKRGVEALESSLSETMALSR